MRYINFPGAFSLRCRFVICDERFSASSQRENSEQNISSHLHLIPRVQLLLLLLLCYVLLCFTLISPFLLYTYVASFFVYTHKMTIQFILYNISFCLYIFTMVPADLDFFNFKLYIFSLHFTEFTSAAHGDAQCTDPKFKILHFICASRIGTNRLCVSACLADCFELESLDLKLPPLYVKCLQTDALQDFLCLLAISQHWVAAH